MFSKIEEFIKNNPHCQLSIEEEKLIIDNPWGQDSHRLSFDSSDYEKIAFLNKLALKPQFDAIIHVDENIIEFFYGYIPSDADFKDRKFSFHFCEKKYECYYAEPTKRLLDIAANFIRVPTQSGSKVSQLPIFKDSQRLDKLPERLQKFFETKVPRNFFLKVDEPVLSIDLETLCHHINLLMSYYDRLSPYVNIRDKEASEVQVSCRPLRFIENKFPETLILQPIDDIILRLLNTAIETSPRFAFLYYYQVFEYAGFYFTDEYARKKLQKVIRDPAILNNTEEKLSEVFEIFSELQANEDVKMKKVIEQYCAPEVVWKEIENDKIFFSNKIIFDGGFELPALISAETTLSTWCTMWMPKLYDTFTKIRNCLVHARERRQSKVILPSRTNNLLIEHYLPLIRRVAEQIAFYNR